VLAGLAGATISLAISPGWFSELTTGGLGWIAIGLVIFAQWDPVRGMLGAYAFGALRRMILDIQGPTILLGVANPFYYNPYWGFFLQMLPCLYDRCPGDWLARCGAQAAGAPAALGVPARRKKGCRA
jgi:simple sugar transport system permease protein